MSQFDITAAVWFMVCGIILIVGMFEAHELGQSFFWYEAVPVACLSLPSVGWFIFRSRTSNTHPRNKRKH